MFTGIVESVGIVKHIEQHLGNLTFWIESSLTSELKIDQSIAHNGICLTIEEIKDNQFRVTAVPETLAKTNAGTWKAGDLINLERAMVFNARVDGHLVQGHVDTKGYCDQIQDLETSWVYTFRFPEEFGHLIIEKGSIAINGISLTCYHVANNKFTVSIIPYTYEHTNIKQLKVGDPVNLEFDLIGKYINRANELFAKKDFK